MIRKIYIYPLSIIFGIFLYYILFSSNFITPDYSFNNPQNCVEIINYTIGDTLKDYKYPFSCDQEFYYSGFENFTEVFEETYNYQSRPLYILGGYLMYVIVSSVESLLNIDFKFTTQLAIFLYQLVIINSITAILFNSFKEKFKLRMFDYVSLLVLVMINPIYKWGLFVPSHQTATLLLIAFFIYFSSKKDIEVDERIAFLFGLFFLFHRSFLVSYLALVLFKNIKRLFIGKTYIRNVYLFVIFLLPNIIYEFFIRFILKRSTYDANTEYWGQFVWLYDYIRGKVRYESEWHCVTVPENFYCYFNDFKQMILYIAFPLLLVLLLFAADYIVNKKNKYMNLQDILFITFCLFLFWSLIGWYPPIRFNFYSVGHMVTLLLILIFLSQETAYEKIIILTSSIFAYLLLPHWNYPEINLEINKLGPYSLLGIFIYLIIKIYLKSNKAKV
jgi:hypothetical protein